MPTRELELNKRYNWQELVDAYPDMYVYLTEVEHEGHKVISGILVGVSTYEQREDTFNKLHQMSLNFMTVRTTPSGRLGGMWHVKF